MGVSLTAKNIHLWYGENEVLRGIDVIFEKNKITSLIGPSGCGKSTLLRCFNRMNDLVPGTKFEGNVYLDDFDIYSSESNLRKIREKIGMVFQQPLPFPMSVYENIAYGLKLKYQHLTKKELDIKVELSLQQAAVWDEVKDNLNKSALSFSGGQQQRICIARTLAVHPDIILMDEPTSALDPIATSRIESLLIDLKKKYTIIVVTHNMQQASRISDNTIFMLNGMIVESGNTKNLFINPKKRLTSEYLNGRFG